MAQFDQAKLIAEAIKNNHGRALIIGGFVRDQLLSEIGQRLTPKDIDLEVFGIAPDKLRDILSLFGKVEETGAEFAVLRVMGIDVSIPRRDLKTGVGHRGFLAQSDPSLSFEQASKRRDLTINALGLDPLTGEILDAFGGRDDLRQGILRAVDLETFGEDSLRVLRLGQFAARFNFRIEDKTRSLARSVELADLPNARIGEEWRKLLLLSERPSVGVQALLDLLAIEKLHSELAALVGVEQDPGWHPEGDVWKHSLETLDMAAQISIRESLNNEDALVIRVSALCHDLGKPAVTRFFGGRIRSHGHEEAGIEPTKRFLSRMGWGNNLVFKVTPLVANHLFPTTVKILTERAVRRLANRLQPATITELVLVSEADVRGRGDPDRLFPQGDKLLKFAQGLEVVNSPTKPIIQGRDLIDLGFTPGVPFGEVLRQIQNEFLDGQVTSYEQARERAKELFEKR